MGFSKNDTARIWIAILMLESWSPNMPIPTSAELLDRIAGGMETVGIVPFSPDDVPKVGDAVEFQEATFLFGVPRIVRGGRTITLVLTKALDTHETYFDAKLIEIEWEPPER